MLASYVLTPTAVALSLLFACVGNAVYDKCARIKQPLSTQDIALLLRAVKRRERENNVLIYRSSKKSSCLYSL